MQLPTSESGAFTVDGWRGIAWTVSGWAQVWEPCTVVCVDDETGEEWEDEIPG